MKEGVLQHAAVAVAVWHPKLKNCLPLPITRSTGGRIGRQTYDRTKRSRFNHLGFLGLNFMNLLKRTWATGAMPL